MISPSFDHLPRLSLYIHIPWCVRKCPYCDFNSHANAGALPEDAYVDALLADFAQDSPYIQGRKLQSIFIGGGTPSLFSAQAIKKILHSIQQRVKFSSTIEITLEANPGTVEQDKFAGFFDAGVNRLSIGVQSFHDEHLKKLGRIHGGDEAKNAIKSAQRAGFSNINIDLMHGLPNQTQAQGLADLTQAIALSPTHISWYQLTIEPNTAFYSSKPTLPSDDQLSDIQCAGEELLLKHQFQQYEVSAYSQKGKQSQHNLNYWLFGDYIGIGAGAHGKITFNKQHEVYRMWKTRAPNDYLQQNLLFQAGTRLLTPQELPLEFMMNALRLNDGFSLQLFTQNTGLEYSVIEKNIQDLVLKDLLTQSPDTIKTSTLGGRFLNEVLTVF